jgi:hypothetical protein
VSECHVAILQKTDLFKLMGSFQNFYRDAFRTAEPTKNKLFTELRLIAGVVLSSLIAEDI